MHGPPRPILDENLRHPLIALIGRDSSPGHGSAAASTAARKAPSTTVGAVHPGPMVTVLARYLVTVALALGASSGVWPLEPRPEVVDGFAPPASPWGAGHRGVDLAGRIGERVHAAQAGTITFAGLLAGRGVVVVDHGPTRTTYEPVRPSVHVGDPVAAGTVIGTLQLFGSHCFPQACLHWGLIRGSTYLDPLRLVGARPVRLLPLYSPFPAIGTAPLANFGPVVDLRYARGWAWR
jgi:murein DD-endopeptidase MepM/ murein hydrolase activator NlpD